MGCEESKVEPKDDGASESRKSSISSISSSSSTSSSSSSSSGTTVDGEEKPSKKSLEIPTADELYPEDDMEWQTQGYDHIEISEDIIRRYLELQAEINKFQKRNVDKKHEVKVSQVSELKKNVDSCEQAMKECQEKTRKEKSDVDRLKEAATSVKEYLESRTHFDEELNKEEQEYVEALSKEEAATKEYKKAANQYEKALEALRKYKNYVDRLNQLLSQQDKILGGLFDGDYGSAEENELEEELDSCLEVQQRISLTRFRWVTAKASAALGLTQLGTGVAQWEQMSDNRGMKARYMAIAEARNSMLAASNSIFLAVSNIGFEVDIPYCGLETMTTFEDVIVNMFVCAQEDYENTAEKFRKMNRDATALNQWIDKVLRERIEVDLQDATQEVETLQFKLREVRLQLMLDKAIDKGIEIPQINTDNDIDSDAESETSRAVLIERQLSKNSSTDELEPRAATPLPDDQLADVPPPEKLFGKLSNLQQDFEAKKMRLNAKEQQARQDVEEQIESKLRRRRSLKERATSAKNA